MGGMGTAPNLMRKELQLQHHCPCVAVSLPSCLFLCIAGEGWGGTHASQFITLLPGDGATLCYTAAAPLPCA